MIVPQHMASVMSRHGIKCEAMKSAQAVRKRNMKILEDKASSEKFKGGMTHLRKRSWIVLKSSIPF